VPKASDHTSRRYARRGQQKRRNYHAFSLEWDAPKAGVYDARVTNIEIIYSEPRAVRISYQTESDPIYGVSEYLPIDAPLRHPRHADTAQGKARIAQLARTAGVDPKSITSLEAIPELFVGARVKIEVGLQYKNGLPIPIVRTVLEPVGSEPQAEENWPEKAE
jgi:hypothetical protein